MFFLKMYFIFFSLTMASNVIAAADEEIPYVQQMAQNFTVEKVAIMQQKLGTKEGVLQLKIDSIQDPTNATIPMLKAKRDGIYEFSERLKHLIDCLKDSVKLQDQLGYDMYRMLIMRIVDSPIVERLLSEDSFSSRLLRGD